MSKPPSGYPGPEGYPCGKSWKKSLIVTGKIPGKHFGQHLAHTLPPVASNLDSGKHKLGWGGEYEDARREQLFDRLEDVVEQLKIAQTWLTDKEIVSIEWLTYHAAAELDAAKGIHEQWKMRKKGAFPLSYPDKMSDFFPAENPQDCAGGDLGPNYGAEVEGVGRSGTVKCPTRSELKQRPKDRASIANRFIDAAHHIRCAEYGLWRLSLYRQAVDAWHKTPAGSAPGDLTTIPKEHYIPGDLTLPPPGPGPGGLIVGPKGPPPPPDPADMKLPPPPKDPVPPQPTPTGPDAKATKTPTTHAQRRKKGSSFTTKAVIGAAVIGVGVAVVKSRG